MPLMNHYVIYLRMEGIKNFFMNFFIIKIFKRKFGLILNTFDFA
jgi:hypothetical protein